MRRGHIPKKEKKEIKEDQESQIDQSKAILLGGRMSPDLIIRTPEIIIIVLCILNILLAICLHLGAHASDCRGQLVTKTKSADGQTCTRQAKLSIHEAEMDRLDR